MKRIALYARISTNRQDHAMQTRELREYCERRGFEIVQEFVDHISSGKEHRPALEQLMTACRKRLVDTVLVYRYDRFARSLRQLVNALCEFDALGIQFISLHEGVDTSTPNGRLVFGIFASIAEFEKELIRDRVRSGLANARAKGKVFGRPRRAVDLIRVAQLRQNGRSFREIGREMGLDPTLICRAFNRSNHPSETQAASSFASVFEEQRVCA
jgi:DNA invertase Pin-like site-specific DNA recombinase